MLAAIEPPPQSSSAPADLSWGDIGKTALLDVLRSLTGGKAAAEVASKVGGLFGDDTSAAAAAAKREADAASQRQMVMVLGGVAGAVVLAALLMRR